MPIYKAPENVHSVSVGGSEYKVDENGYIETSDNIGNAIFPLGFTVVGQAALDAQKAAEEKARLAQEAKAKEEAELKKAEEAKAKAEADKAKKAEADAQTKAVTEAKAKEA